MIFKIKDILYLVLLLVLPQILMANVQVNQVFSDHMVVQQQANIPIWGWADPNEKIVIKTTWGVTTETITKMDGTWKAILKTPKAGGPYQIIILGNNTITINDVLSGEVWLCTGQSNMDFAMSKFVNNSRELKYQPLVKNIKTEIANANDDWIRHIEVPQITSLFTKKYNFNANWKSANAEGIAEITATGYFFAKELRKHLNVPIGLIECSWGGTRIQPWLSKEAYLSDENMKAYFEASTNTSKNIIQKISAEYYEDTTYVAVLKEWKANGKKTAKPYPKKHPTIDIQLPATLYNGMLSSIMPFAIKGVLWYQGESNSHFLEDEYEAYFTKMIQTWRAAWEQGDFPFYWTQLANYSVSDKRSDLGWASVNNQLRKTMKLPNTGMAVLHDIGEAKDVHPHNKMDAGKRLALWALEKDYKVKVAAVSGPLYKSYKVKKNKIQVKFIEVGTGLMVGDKHLMDAAIAIDDSLKWFEIQDHNEVWRSAEAKIISKNKIEVWNNNVDKPLNVRYAWSSNPEGANLYNKEGLPAAVFSTEK